MLCIIFIMNSIQKMLKNVQFKAHFLSSVFRKVVAHSEVHHCVIRFQGPTSSHHGQGRPRNFLALHPTPEDRQHLSRSWTGTAAAQHSSACRRPCSPTHSAVPWRPTQEGWEREPQRLRLLLSDVETQLCDEKVIWKWGVCTGGEASESV